MLVDIETSRLLLRRWKEEDLKIFIKMNKDKEVMKYFPSTHEEEKTKEFYEIIQKEFFEKEYGLYTVEEKCSNKFMGFIGFHHATLDVDFCPCIEIGWRLNKEYWGKGYATEGAKACLKHGFEHLKFEKVYSFTALENIPSQKVMKKIGMNMHKEFEHPEICKGDLLRPHICYVIDNNSL